MANYEPVICPAILMAEKVIREHGSGKLSLINTFNVYVARDFPFQTHPFFVCAWITNISGKIQTLDATVRIEEPDTGHVYASSRNHLEFKPDSPPIPKHIVFELIFPFRSITLPKAGSYTVAVLVNNESLGRQLFHVQAATQSPSQEQVK